MCLATEMLNDLETWRLEVVLIPAPDPQHSCHRVRCVQSQNPVWYRKFCELYPSGRQRRSWKPDTRIKREQTVRALKRIIDGDYSGEYADRLLHFIDRHHGMVEGVPF